MSISRDHAQDCRLNGEVCGLDPRKGHPLHEAAGASCCVWQCRGLTEYEHRPRLQGLVTASRARRVKDVPEGAEVQRLSGFLLWEVVIDRRA